MSYINHVESEQMYLKTIYKLKKIKPDLRAVDIARELEFRKSSVSAALKSLKEKDYITIEDNIINFTDAGYKQANNVCNNYNLLFDIFKKIGIEEEEAKDIACKTEHVLTEEMYKKLKDAIKNHKEHAADSPIIVKHMCFRK